MTPLRTVKKVPHKQLERVLMKQADAIQRLAQATATDFETYSQELQRVRELLADALVQIETLKVQIAGLLVRFDGSHG